jgi:hypothetical protein
MHIKVAIGPVKCDIGGKPNKGLTDETLEALVTETPRGQRAKTVYPSSENPTARVVPTPDSNIKGIVTIATAPAAHHRLHQRPVLHFRK